MIEWGTVIVGALSLIGVIVSNVLANRKTTAVIGYRIEQLEKKQDKHNSVIERVYRLEESQAVTDEKIDAMHKRVEKLEGMK